QIPRIGQLVQHSHAGITKTWIAAGQQRTYIMRADEASATGYQNPHELICTLLWSPRTSRWALGTRGAGVTSTSWPMIDASIRRTPRIDALRRTMEYSISQSSMVQSSATEVNGPT